MNDFKAQLAEIRRQMLEKRGAEQTRTKAGVNLTLESQVPGGQESRVTSPASARVREESTKSSQFSERNERESRYDRNPPETLLGEADDRNVPASDDVQVVVGIDFGTSTTKVCVRELLGDSDDVRIYAVPLGGTFELCPSAVAVEGGRVYFGHDAIAKAGRTGARTFAHLKVCFACGVAGRGAPLLDCTAFREPGGACSGRFRGPGDSTVSAYELAALFLAWVRSEVVAFLPKVFGDGRRFACTYHVGVPLGHLGDNPKLETEYAQMACLAFRELVRVSQGKALVDALTEMGEVCRRGDDRSSGARVDVSTEAEAALMAFAKSPGAEKGLYGVVDIGAWTTDTAFFWLAPAEANGGIPEIVFLGADSKRVAVNHLDEQIARYCLDVWGVHETREAAGTGEDTPHSVVEKTRRLREEGGLGDGYTEPVAAGPFLIRRRRRALMRAAIELGRQHTFERIREGFHRALNEAREREPEPSRWEGFPTYVVGGGAAEPALWKGIERATPVSGGLSRLPFARPVGGIREADIARYVVATGLAFPKALMPDSLQPRDVPAVDRNAQLAVRSRSKRYEVYENDK